MKADELREKYLTFFEQKGHKRCPSDVLVPTWDPSVLFTPAGMNQFKDHFLGKVKLTFTRATTCQKCLRTADIENVGRTPFHHTFFEMLGNFSFGDYFKREAILWAWEFCTSKQWLGLPPDRLSVSVYVDDEEAYRIWHEEVGLEPGRIARMGEDENFWPANAPSEGPDGVCGPCSEIFYHVPGGKPVEIWNLVFTQFNRVGPPPDNLRPLPSKNIDTGMGLERTAAVLQGVETSYHIDIMRPIVEAAAEVCGVRYEPASDAGRALRRIADHVRACTFAIHENVYPGPQKEKYVVRRLLRRAVLEGHRLGRRDPFLYQLVPVVVEMMRHPYPELQETQQRVAQAIRQEEESFLATLDTGLARVQRLFGRLRQEGKTVVPGEEAAELYQTYGIPPELLESLAVEEGFTFDWPGFRTAMEAHRQKPAAEVAVFKTGPVEALKRALKATEFLGYQTTVSPAVVRGIVRGEALADAVRADQLKEGEKLIVVLDQSPFYPEGGGQVGDTGYLLGEGSEGPRFRVVDTQRDGELILHYGFLEQGTLTTGLTVTAQVDQARRQGIRRAHSATHLLHHALQQVLGRHAQQQGSKVEDDWLRFDFTHLTAVTPEELEKIEEEVKRRIAQRAEVKWEYLPLAEARKAGAMMLFGEKYPDPVRMVTMGDFSRELCGGTHLDNTAEVEEFEIISEEAVSAGTRRIVALTGEKARRHAAQTRQALQEAAQRLQVSPLQVPEAVQSLQEHVRALRKVLSGAGTPPTGPWSPPTPQATQQVPYTQARAALRQAARLLNVAPLEVPERISQLMEEAQRLQEQLQQLDQQALSADSLLQQAVQVDGILVIAREAPGAAPPLMRQLIDQIRRKAPSCAVLLASRTDEGKVQLVAGVTRDLVKKGLDASKWVREVAAVVGGGGGGRPDMAQAGGKNPEKLPQALEKAVEVIRRQLVPSEP